MISCEQFESLYPFVENADTLAHRKTCPHCAVFSRELSELRRYLLGIPQFAAPVGFEFRLQRRLQETSRQSAREWKAAPRAIAFASGIAVVLIAGAIYRNMQVQPTMTAPLAVAPAQDSLKTTVKSPEKPLSTEASDSDEILLAEAQSDSSLNDTLRTPATSPWGSYNLMETVSAQK